MTAPSPGPAPEPPEHFARPPAGPEIVVVVRDTADSLERVFGTVRRRAMDLKALSLGRFGDDLVLVLRSERSDPVPDRWLAELEGLVDVHHVRVAVTPAYPGPESDPESPFEGDPAP